MIQQTNAVLRGKYDMHMTAERYISDDADSLRMAADLSETREFGEAPSDCGRRFSFILISGAGMIDES